MSHLPSFIRSTLSVICLGLVLTPGLANAAPARRALPPATQPTFATLPDEGARAYTLGPGDRIKVEVLKAPQYGLDTQVLVDGTLSLLQVGRISVQGLTLDQAQAIASERYRKYLRYPVVTLTLVSPRPVKVSVAGEVSRRGSYDLTTRQDNNTDATGFPTVTRALKLAGGITQSANLRQVRIRRPQRGKPDLMINANLWEFLQTGDPAYDVVLRDGDALFVPTAEQLDINEAYQLATTSFSAEKVQPLNITIVGEVYRPGTHTVESSVSVATAGQSGQPRDSFNQARIFPTLTRAIQTAGGVKPMADIRQVQVRRVMQNGVEQTFTVDLWALLSKGDQKQDLILQDRDTIAVPTADNIPNIEASKIATSTLAPDKIRVSVVGEVERPGIVEVPPNTPLNQAILVAGGFNKRAERGKIDFVRINPDNTVAQREVAVNFAQGLDDTNNPALRNEDVIVVRASGIAKAGDRTGLVLNPVTGILSVLGSIFGIIR